VHISVTDAKAQLTELVRRAENGDEVVLTRHGHATVRLVPIKQPRNPKALRALIDEIQVSAKPTPGPCAARSQDFLYDDDGLPR
jgi:prevent-host-death family protein